MVIRREQQAPARVPFAIEIAGPLEFSFQEALVYLKRSAKECMYQAEGQSVRKLLEIEGEYVLMEISSVDDRTLQVRYEARDEATQQKVVQYVREWFDLDTDLKPFYALAAGDDVLKNLVERHYGLRVVRIPDLFEALCWAVMGQQINLAFAYTLKRRFVEAFGEGVSWEGQTYWVFPRPKKVAELSVEELTALQFTGKKAEYLIEVARQMADGNLTKQALLERSPAEAEKMMVNIRGIGPWTANYVRMRCLGDTSAFPIADVGLHNALKAQLGMERKPTLAEIEKLSAAWKKWEAYATFYLWRSLYETV